MNANRRWLQAALVVLTTAVVAPPALADYVASPEEIRALRTKLAKSPPQPADYAAQPYPGAKFDAECSAEATAPRLPDGAGYCFYTLDPVDKVQAYLKAAGKPRNGGVSVSAREDVVSVDGIVKIDKVTMITYSTKPSYMAYYDSFPDSPPPAADLIAPLYPGATYDKDCSAAKSLEAKGKPKWRQVWCFVANEPYSKVRDAFDLELRSTSKRGVQVDLTELSLDPPVMQIQYWLAAEPPQAAAATTPTTTPAESSASAAVPATAPTAEPASAPTDVVKKSKETVDKLRGLFGH
jgi:hypothetical protein